MHVSGATPSSQISSCSSVNGRVGFAIRANGARVGCCTTSMARVLVCKTGKRVFCETFIINDEGPSLMLCIQMSGRYNYTLNNLSILPFISAFNRNLSFRCIN